MVFATSLAAAGNRDLSAATLFAVCLTELQILCKNSNVFIHKKYRTRAALILMQQFKEKKILSRLFTSSLFE